MFNAQEVLEKLQPLSVENIEDIGDILQYLIPWAALLVVALQGDKEGAWNWLYAGTATTLLTYIGKFVFNFTSLGKRPDGGIYSFPSGHTSSAFMGAAFFHFQVGIVWAIIPYALAILTGYSRVWSGKHWVHDVVAGALLAIIITYGVVIVI
ncbi:phosphatase PAP2 family protein [Candidatus Saccharibacteria bacterium]|nr:phosphatase PAP2 family protein [Candidatus Saccharibacteria bacterium]NIV04284.1 phosphatase PAP2 family protein [Calditrichia bacterium]NIV72775.1 phosphatase PAP2 family protein [Calditrichia bacterium]NIV99946.1 phosphatase PAP2 family protein [Candidatus Saccharibacteria bacterium]NIW80202.1 phosphatase PAP2 family protein [Calditrichia bacterium]